MKLEQQVCSLELAKRLKELNCPQESLFWWANAGTCFGTANYIEHHDTHTLCAEWELPNKEYFEEFGGSYYSAYTVAELGEMLPNNIETYKRDEWNIRLNDKGQFIVAHTEADARAKMLIYLIQNGLVDVKSLKI